MNSTSEGKGINAVEACATLAERLPRMAEEMRQFRHGAAPEYLEEFAAELNNLAQIAMGGSELRDDDWEIEVCGDDPEPWYGSLDEFCEANEELADEVREIKPGHSKAFGGGASPIFQIYRRMK